MGNGMISCVLVFPFPFLCLHSFACSSAISSAASRFLRCFDLRFESAGDGAEWSVSLGAEAKHRRDGKGRRGEAVGCRARFGWASKCAAR